MNASELFLKHTGAKVPVICGAMYPCTNPELVAAVGNAGGIAIVQPLSLVYAQKLDLRDALRRIRAASAAPYGFNVLTEQSSKVYLERMRAWVDIALEEGCRFFVTALGDPKWIVERVKPLGGVVYHDVTERKWAEKALKSGVDGFICVNNRAGGHAGRLSPEELLKSIGDLGKPIVCAGGVGDAAGFTSALEQGYAAVQMGTRFIASAECTAHADYKAAIVRAKEADIVLTDRLTGVPVSIIRTPSVEREGTRAGWLARKLLKNSRTKHWMRLWYMLISTRKLKLAARDGLGYRDYWQAGKSVAAIDRVESVAQILAPFVEAYARRSRR